MYKMYNLNSNIYHSAQDMRKEILGEYKTVVNDAISAVKKDFPDLPIVDESLVYAIIAVESKGNAFATRFEPEFSAWLNTRVTDKDIVTAVPGVKAGLVSRATERCHRATSFGLMQILGQTAREQGFKGIYMTELCEPMTNLYFCIKYLARLLKQHTKREHAIASYNAGSVRYGKDGKIINQIYIDKVLTEEHEILGIMNNA